MPKHQEKITKFYKRFLTSEFTEERSVTIQGPNDISSLLRTFDSCGLAQQAWKNERGFILGDNVEMDSEGRIMVSGFVKGSCINPNQLVHVTGVDDFQV